MTSIKITRNCQNGEHTFIPALTHTDGRDHFVMAFVCQHCLFHVNEKEWENHIKENFTNERKEPTEEPLFNAESLPPLQHQRIAGLEYAECQKQTYPGKRRGPKPKKQGSD
jgi:hypothetical protein